MNFAHQSISSWKRLVISLALLTCVWNVEKVDAQLTSLIADPKIEFSTALSEFNEGQRLLISSPDRARELFRSSAKRFEGIAALGITNGRLEFNTGNAFLQGGDVGRAILHYLRAKRLIPGDPLLNENLRVARTRCLLSIPPSARSQILQTVFFWHFDTSTADRTRAMLLAYFAFWIFLTIRLWLRRPAILWAAIASVVVALALWVSVAHDSWSDRHNPIGVVTSMDVVVYKGPGASYQRQFEQPLQPGVEFTLLEKRSGWFNIELADGKTGWVAEQTAALVPTS